MKIKKLVLNNFMAFENAEINWSDNINIICGENSTGKTTLLKVMYSLIKPFSNGSSDNLTKEMAEQLELNLNTVKYHIRKLQKNGRIKRQGTKKKGGWTAG